MAATLHSVPDPGEPRGARPLDEHMKRLDALEARQRAVKRAQDLSWAQQTFSTVTTLAVVGIAALLAGLAVVAARLGEQLGLTPRGVLVATIVLGLGSGVALVAAFLVPPLARALRIQRRDEEEAREAAAKAADELADHASLRALIRANRRQMEAYDVLARSQARTAFRNSQVAMGVGLLVLVAGAIVAVGTEDATARITTASLSAIGGILSGFIARTFLRTYRASLDQLNYYFQQPLVTSYLLSAERLIGSMSRAQRDATFASLINHVMDVLIRLPGVTQEIASSRARRPDAQR